MTFAATGSFLFANTSALTVNNQGTGNLLLVEVTNNNDNTVFCTGLTGGGATWTQVGTAFPSTGAAPFPGYAVVFAGKVTATGAGTVTPSWSGTAPASYELDGHEFTSTAGSWALDVQGNLSVASGSDWPSLTPATGGELYFGAAQNNGSASAGSTSGYVYSVTPNGNGCAYNVSCPQGAATFPVWGDTGEVFGVAVLMTETGAAPAPYPAQRQAARSRLPRGPYVTGNPGLVYQVSRDGTP